MTHQLSLPHRFCLIPEDWAAKHWLCYVCYGTQKECKCPKFVCCSEVGNE